MMKWAFAITAAVALALGVWIFSKDADVAPVQTAAASAPIPEGALVAVAVPESFNPQEQTGKRAFDAVCATCHGVNAQGQVGVAPPLVHKIYEPSHHGDMSFVVAAKNGVRAHHWKFGSMPPVEGVTQADVLNIVSYIRALQRENGIN